MPRPIGRQAASDREWDLRIQVKARVRELLGDKPVAELAKRLGDESRTRAHKILNPDQAREVGQSITLALVMDLAQAFDMSVVEFLAPILGPDAAHDLEQAAHDRLVHDIAENERRQLEAWQQAVEREDVQGWLQDVLHTAPLMTPDRVAHERESLWAWKQLFGLPAAARARHTLGFAVSLMESGEDITNETRAGRRAELGRLWEERSHGEAR